MHACSSQRAVANLKYLQVNLKTDRLNRVELLDQETTTKGSELEEVHH